MKPIQIHPFSALAGAGVLTLVLLGTGVAPPHGTQRVFIENDPRQAFGVTDPLDVVSFNGSGNGAGMDHTVPAGKSLVILAVSRHQGTTRLSLGDVDLIDMPNDSAQRGMEDMRELIVLPSGTVFTVFAGFATQFQTPVVYGYLIDE